MTKGYRMIDYERVNDEQVLVSAREGRGRREKECSREG
jgi:hypothetical protein